MAELYLDNPAGRLHRILIAMKEAKPNMAVAQAMPGVLGVNPPYLPIITRAMAEFFLLPDEVRSEVQALRGSQSKDRLLQWHPKVMEALNCLLFQNVSPPRQIGAIAGIYGDGDLMSLEFCSEALHLARAELVIEQTALAAIRERLVELLGILESDTQLDAELRELLIWNVSAMLRACDSYSRRGVAGIRDTYNQTVGSLVTNRNATVRHDSSPKTWEKFIGVLGLISAALSFGTAVTTALEAPASAPPAVIQVLPIVEPPFVPLAERGSETNVGSSADSVDPLCSEPTPLAAENGSQAAR